MEAATPRWRPLRLGEPKAQIYAPSGPLRHSSASPKRTSPPRSSIVLPRCTCKSRFGSSLPLILTIKHLINEDPNK